ncbi:ergothioneine biosynthesis protein EgtB [Roseateles terrae]|uniref:Ergothioneine biosynthesis protein EgtB n=1 Tax=Roseateles terrae TaxID=431060 RepID=A0ABR6GVY2_9BURK|nr:ergothioneine biosynthesis protein EgtB [Roseateles terrae]MBB3196265.1 ergothioneine biosynthesis protein EgtB [Roseateles terrae]OWQ83977.1 sulfatase maturase [Roseateles terrae]
MSDVPRPLPQRHDLARRFDAVRAHTLALVETLSPEDQAAQSMPDASPAKWHQAHTTWFFEALLLRPHLAGYQPLDESYHYLFNSYYEGLGPRHPRPQRGLLTRPSLAQVRQYRLHVEQHMHQLIEQCSEALWPELASTLELGLQHEQQHQELILTDALHLLSCHPWRPALLMHPPMARAETTMTWCPHPGGLVEIGHAGDGFAFDNEGPRHRVWLEPFEIGNRLVSCGDYLGFIEAGGYQDPQWWLSEGWATVQAQQWQAPAYWVDTSGEAEADTVDTAPRGRWSVFGLQGLQPLDPAAPVTQLSFYEAAAYAEWAGARLPSEAEWEAAIGLPGMEQLWDQAWQWTRSAYHPYPGFRPLSGVASEYNGKFMVGQLVLRGGSVATPPGHTRPTYRNFFPPGARWQFSGLRLARDASQRGQAPRPRPLSPETSA